MKKTYFLLLLAALPLNALAIETPAFDLKTKSTTIGCDEILNVTVLQPNCESATATVTVTSPLGANYQYSINGTDYQESPIFTQITPGSYTVTYQNTDAGCTSAENLFIVTYMPVAIANMTSAPETSYQTVCRNTPMTAISYMIGGTASTATVSGLPPGVTLNSVDGIFTISGTPTNSGVFNYTFETDGNCPAAATGTIVVPQNVFLMLNSAPSTTNQTLCQYNLITPIRYIAANGATGVSVTGLPAGIDVAFTAGLVVISGIPTEDGTFNYTVTTTGGCLSANLSGVIHVSPGVLVNLSCDSASSTATMLAFDWDTVPGASSYHYKYSIDGGSFVVGNVSANSHYNVPGVSPGQSVVFTISANGTCSSTETVTCSMPLLNNTDFYNSTFRFFPNPVNDIIQITADVAISGFAIFNTFGQSVMKQTDSFGKKLEINLSALRPGIYFITLNTLENQQTFKIVKR